MKNRCIKSAAGALVLTALAFGMPQTASADPISPEQAAKVATDFRMQNMATKASAQSPDLAYTSISDNRHCCFYVFNYGQDGGFTIVSADDRLPAVLGYTEAGSFDAENLPDNVKWWLDSYTQQIEAWYSSPELQESNVNTPVATRAMNPIQPLLTTKWNQSAPYNDLCEMKNGRRCVTGCVATAMAQVMKYHNWPVNPTGSIDGYVFSGTTLDWANMLDDYIEGQYDYTQANAVALLMVQCGKSVKMNYTPYESGAYSNAVQTALTTYFDYNPGLQMLFREYYSYAQWVDIVYTELANKRPVYYSGQAKDGGHAFVCDGYSNNDYFHFNWGWGGMYDGYFLLNSLNPGTGGIGSYEGGYNSSQCIMTGVEKSNGTGTRQYSLISTGGLKYNSSTGAFEVSGAPDGQNLVYNPHDYDFSVRVGFKIEDAADASKVEYVGVMSANFKPYYGFSELKLDKFPSLSDGTYRVSFALNDGTDWQPILIPYTMQPYVNAIVKNGSVTYENVSSKDRTAKLIVNDVEHSDVLYADSPLALRLYVSNVGELDYSGNLKAVIEYPKDQRYNIEMSVDVNLPEHFTSPVDISDSFDFEPGTYNLYIYDKDDKQIGGPFALKSVDAPFRRNATDVRVGSITPSFANNEDPYSMATRLSVSNVSPTITDNYTVYLYDAADDSEMLKMTFQDVSVGAYAPVTLSSGAMDISKIPTGSYYWSIVNSEGKNLCDPYMLKLYSGPFRANSGAVWYKNNDGKKTAFVGPDNEGSYSGKVEVPEKVDGYTINRIQGGTFTFASQLESLSLPEAVNVINPAEFYYAVKLKSLRVGGYKPFKISSLALPEDRWGEIQLSVPNGKANVYKRTDIWSQFFMPSWTITVDDDCAITDGLAIDPETDKFYEPYYVSENERPIIEVTSPTSDELFILYTIDGGEQQGVWTNNGQLRFPALTGKSGTIRITAEKQEAVEDVLSDQEPCDVYDLSGRVVLRDATLADKDLLTSGIYVAKNRKFIVK